MFIATLFNNSQKVETTQMSINKMWHTHAMQIHKHKKIKCINICHDINELGKQNIIQGKSSHREKVTDDPHTYFMECLD